MFECVPFQFCTNLYPFFMVSEAVVAALRAVGKDEKAPLPAHVKTVTQAASSGTTRELLVATRDRIAVSVEDPNTAARDLAALTKRLMETVRDIEAIDARDTQEAGENVEVSDGKFDASAV